MSFGRGTQGRRDGTNQFDLRMRKHIRQIAHMKDGTTRDVPTLCDYEELRQSGLVLRFEIVEVENLRILRKETGVVT